MLSTRAVPVPQIAKDVKQFYDQALQQAVVDDEAKNAKAVVKTFHETVRGGAGRIQGARGAGGVFLWWGPAGPESSLGPDLEGRGGTWDPGFLSARWARPEVQGFLSIRAGWEGKVGALGSVLPLERAILAPVPARAAAGTSVLAYGMLTACALGLCSSTAVAPTHCPH